MRLRIRIGPKHGYKLTSNVILRKHDSYVTSTVGEIFFSRKKYRSTLCIDTIDGIDTIDSMLPIGSISATKRESDAWDSGILSPGKPMLRETQLSDGCSDVRPTICSIELDKFIPLREHN